MVGPGHECQRQAPARWPATLRRGGVPRVRTRPHRFGNAASANTQGASRMTVTHRPGQVTRRPVRRPQEPDGAGDRADLRRGDGVWRHGDPVGRRRFVDVGDLALERGGVLPDVRIAYETWGRLNETRDNVVLVEHALTGDSHVV